MTTARAGRLLEARAPLFVVRLLFFVLLVSACNTTGDPASPQQPENHVSALPQDDAGTPPADAAADTADAADGALDADDGSARCAPAFAGCTTFTDATAAGDARTVTFQNYDYTPKCLSIRAGQSVTFTGDFYTHPLAPSCGPESLEYRSDAGTTASKSFTLTVPGIYGYYCLDHGNPQGAAMSGAIQVVP